MNLGIIKFIHRIASQLYLMNIYQEPVMCQSLLGAVAIKVGKTTLSIGSPQVVGVITIYLYYFI